MSDEVRASWGVKVPLQAAEGIKSILKEAGSMDSTLIPIVEGGHILFPIRTPEGIPSELGGVLPQLIRRSFNVRHARPRNLREVLSRKLEPSEVDQIRRSFDIVGDIAIISPTETMSGDKNLIVEAIRSIHPRVRLVLAKVSPISGVERVATYERWYGSGATETLHREHGCVYSLDLSKVFFTPRLSAERKRVASLVRANETVCDLFAGVGPFSILISKLQPSSRVRACDVSPDAFLYLRRNIRLNGVSDRIEAFLGDATEVSQTRIRGICDRVIMNLPKGAELFLPAATASLKPSGGVIHLYLFRREPQTLEEKVSNATRQLTSLGWRTAEVRFSRQVREIGPRTYNEVVDIEVS